MATKTTCLPWWHTVLAPLTKSRTYIVGSGCAVNSAGNVACSPESMRASAQKYLEASGYWPGPPLTLDEYTLARYMASEVGSGPAEERVAVGEAGVNRAKLRKQSVSQLLLYTASAANKGYYGPIHGVSGVTSAPYGRWAATSRDPSLADLLIARWILDGTTANFADGADDQVGMEYTAAFPDPAAKVRREAKEGDYWVGPLPGVDHWRTFLFRHYGYKPESAEGQWLLNRGLQAVASRDRPDWSGLSVCSRSSASSSRLVLILGGLSVLVVAGLFVRRHGLIHLPIPTVG